MSENGWIKMDIDMKTLDNTCIAEAKAKVSDLKVVGDGDTWQLLCKASSKKEGWMKSTKVLEIENVGCLVQVSTQQGDHVAEALAFVPGVQIKANPLQKHLQERVPVGAAPIIKLAAQAHRH